MPRSIEMQKKYRAACRMRTAFNQAIKDGGSYPKFYPADHEEIMPYEIMLKANSKAYILNGERELS